MGYVRSRWLDIGQVLFLGFLWTETKSSSINTAIGLFIEEFSSLLKEVIVCSEELLIVGDFNFHMADTADRYAPQFGSLLELFHLKQHVAVPNHRIGHILYLVKSRKDT